MSVLFAVQRTFTSRPHNAMYIRHEEKKHDMPWSEQGELEIFDSFRDNVRQAIHIREMHPKLWCANADAIREHPVLLQEVPVAKPRVGHPASVRDLQVVSGAAFGLEERCRSQPACAGSGRPSRRRSSGRFPHRMYDQLTSRKKKNDNKTVERVLVQLTPTSVDEEVTILVSSFSTSVASQMPKSDSQRCKREADAKTGAAAACQEGKGCAVSKPTRFYIKKFSRTPELRFAKHSILNAGCPHVKVR